MFCVIYPPCFVIGYFPYCVTIVWICFVLLLDYFVYVRLCVFVFAWCLTLFDDKSKPRFFNFTWNKCFPVDILLFLIQIILFYVCVCALKPAMGCDFWIGFPLIITMLSLCTCILALSYHVLWRDWVCYKNLDLLKYGSLLVLLQYLFLEHWVQFSEILY